MKCPKCGYNSFEFLDSCKKCNNNLVSFKESLGIRPLILPVKEFPAAHLSQEDETIPLSAADTSEESDMFAWGQPADTSQSTNEDPFPSMELDLPIAAEEKPEEHFSFEMDLPGGPPAETGGNLNQFSFDEPGTDAVFGNSEAELPDFTMAQDSGEPAEAPFGEFSFEQISEETDKALPADDGLKSFSDDCFDVIPDSDTPGETKAELSWQAGSEKLSFDEFHESGKKDIFQMEGDAPELSISTGEFTLEGFALPEEPQAKPAKEGGIDSLGLTKDEFDSLFGEFAVTDKQK